MENNKVTINGISCQLNNSQTKVLYCGIWHELQEDQDGGVYITLNNKAVYVTLRDSVTPPAGNDPQMSKDPFELTQDGETIRIYGQTEGSAMTDYENAKEPLETETFFDWCKNSYEFEIVKPAGNDQQTGYEHYESPFKERAGNDLPEQLHRDGAEILTEQGRVIALAVDEEENADEIVRRYNSFPTLQEQNKELIKSLNGMIEEAKIYRSVCLNKRDCYKEGGDNYRIWDASAYAAEQKIKAATDLLSKYSK